jgi:hypothetical protein
LLLCLFDFSIPGEFFRLECFRQLIPPFALSVAVASTTHAFGWYASRGGQAGPFRHYETFAPTCSMYSPIREEAPAMSTDNTPLSEPRPARKPRHKVELWAVRAGILLLVVLAGVQAHARFGYEMSLKSMQARLAAEEESGVPLLVSDLPGLVVGFPSRDDVEERHWRLVVYKWRGLTQSYEIRMPYDSSEKTPAILSLETADAPVPPEPKFVEAPQEASAPPSGGGGPGMGSGMGGGMRGGPRPDLMASDADGDGRISKSEAPERVAANFGEWDTNGDTFIDKDEIAARRARRPQGGGRPPAEGSAPAAPPVDTPPAESAVPAEGAAANGEQPPSKS